MPIAAIDLVTYAAQRGLVISYAIAKDAVEATDPRPFEAHEKTRYEGRVWDGKGSLPEGTGTDPNRWLHGLDGSSRSAIEATDNGGVVYWLFKDGVLDSWQPHRADIPGRIHCVDDPEHRDHWEKAVNAHIDMVVARAVEGLVLKEALGKALEMHEAQDKPYHATIVSQP